MDDDEEKFLKGKDIDLEEELADLKQKKTSMFNLIWLRFKRNKLAIFGGAVIIALIFTAIFAPLLAPYGWNEQDPKNRLKGPSSEHLLGTDDLGRDILSRLMYGARGALKIGILIVLLSGGIGVGLGLLAGAIGGWVDEVIMRLVDTFLSFPIVIMALAIAAILDPSETTTIIAVGVIVWTRFARITRGEILSIKQEPYIEAAKAIGESKLSIMGRYYLPNVLPSIIVVATLQIPAALLYSAALDFLNFGIQPPTPSWGYMVSTGRDFILISPWMATFGGIAIMITVLGFSFMGDGLRDALDPMTSGG